MSDDVVVRTGHGSGLRDTLAVLKNSLRTEAAHYDRRLPRADAIALFRRYVELVEVETTSYCNRTCSFCPNSTIDRRSEKLSMPEASWRRIVEDLRALEYTGTVVWSRFSEPTSEERLIERIAEVRGAAPRCRIAINSNGDYLDSTYLAKLVRAGLNRLFVDIYIPDHEKYEPSLAQAHLARFLKRIGKEAVVTSSHPEFSARVDVAALEMIVNVKNLTSMRWTDMSDRGGLIQIARRTDRVSPCYAPFKNLIIDWDGSVVVCCQVRSDAASLRNTIVARVGEEGTGLVEAYVALADWRSSIRGFGPKAAPCGSCNVFEYRPTTPAVVVSRMLADDKLPVVRLVKWAGSRLIGRWQRW